MEEEEAAAPGLRLEILRGPRQGESIEFRPGSAIRIGRVVKGNTLPIKDPGISSKHLSILTESNKWILRDLDSSNGTVLNDSQIPPHTPFTLTNDSTIKIGEVSSIHVTFIPHQPQQQQTLPPRRNPSRRARTEPEPVLPVTTPGRGRGRVKIKSVDENDASVVNVESGCVDLPPRVTRNSSRVRVCDDASGEKAKEEPKSTTNPSLVDVSDSSVKDLSVPEVVVVVEEPKKSTRVTRNLKKNVECGVEGNVEKKKSKDVTEKRELEKENLNGGDENWPDLSKMTLGEWFDFLEVYLPKQIMDETEGMIDSMRQKAERLREYIVEMQRQKDMARVEE